MWRTKTTNMMIQDSSDFTATLPQLDWWRNTAVQRILYGASSRGMGANWDHIIFEGKLESQIHQIRLLDSGLDYTFLKIRNCQKKYSPLHKNDSMLERSNRYINSNCPNGLPSPALLLAAVVLLLPDHWLICPQHCRLLCTDGNEPSQSLKLYYHGEGLALFFHIQDSIKTLC